MPNMFLSITSLLFILLSLTTATPIIGVTFDPTLPNLPPLPTLVTAFIHYRTSNVRLINPTPATIRAFSSTNITLLISIPNTFLHSFASNQSSSATWLVNNVLPFHHATRISLISIESAHHITRFHLPALRNLYSNLLKLGIINIPVSITFAFETTIVVKNWFTPSQSEFNQPELIRPSVRFLKSINSHFLVTVYQYIVYSSSYNEIPHKFALFQESTRRTDVFTGIEYSNLFDMMVDALVYALERAGEGNVPVIIAETGWPGVTMKAKSDSYMTPFYLHGLMKRLKSGSERVVVDEVYVYEIFLDEWIIMNEFGFDLPDFETYHEMVSGIVHEDEVVVTSDRFSDKTVLWFTRFVAFVVALVLVILGLRKNGYLKVLKVN